MTSSTCAPGVARLARGRRLPDVLAHQHAGSDAVELDDGGSVPGVK